MQPPYYVAEAWKLAEKYQTRDPERIAWEKGIKIIHLPFRSIYGMSLRLGRHKLIGVKSDLPEPAQKLVIGHELGHFVLHPKGNFFFVLTQTLFYGKEEYQANMFAAALMLGEDLVRYEPVVRELAAGKADRLIKILKQEGSLPAP
ncbi:MAG: ImmA/IrrE family metallo-endopeptidase [Thermanaerothrix sp.]|nr:ImmA/IrrE family metallo-endopeptidase [Thermanaerothrix sp.]